MKRALTGIKPTGDAHLGNLFGMCKPAIELQKSYECFYFIADLHALTTQRNFSKLKDLSLDLAKLWLALGLDPNKHIIYRQSDLPQVTELAWYLSCFTGFGLISKAHAFKDAQAKNIEINHATFSYPILMAADILLFDADIVPVGKDQKQHIELARDIANSLNHATGKELLKLPEGLIKEEVMTVTGLDGQKMSKSYNNVIPIITDEKTLKKLIMSIPTDSSGIEESKELDGTVVGAIYKLCENEKGYQDLKSRLVKGGLGWGHAKQELFEVLLNYLQPIWTEFSKLSDDHQFVESVLRAGTEKAQIDAKKVLSRVRAGLGID